MGWPELKRRLYDIGERKTSYVKGCEIAFPIPSKGARSEAVGCRRGVLERTAHCLVHNVTVSRVLVTQGSS